MEGRREGRGEGGDGDGGGANQGRCMRLVLPPSLVLQVNERQCDRSCNAAGTQPNVSSIIKVEQPTKPLLLWW